MPSGDWSIDDREGLGPLSPGTQIGAYRIESVLGQGGMGVVYRALDTKLNRPVAIKVLSARLADAAARRRFQREAQMASALNHPHIVTVYDAGEFEGRQYLVTEFVDGGTLKNWVKAEPHSWRQVVELLTGVADGLAAAHQAGILHRDLKPDNILVAKNGYGKLADFGLAKLEEAPAAGDATQTILEGQTRPGMIVGTIAYMSPEQASGRGLDARSDIFSFGLVLYETLSGRRAFGGASDLEVLQSIIHGSPQPLPEEIPGALRTLVEKSLEKDPAERYQTMRDMVVDLRRLTRLSVEMPAPSIPAPKRGRSWAVPAAITLLLLAVAAAAAWKLWPKTGSHQIHSIAVLPLQNLSGEANQEYFSDGMTEELIASLAQIHSLKVISRTSMMRYKGTTKSLPDIGKELGVDAILESSVRRSGNQVRFTAQLIEASTDAHVWAKDFDRELSNVLQLQGEVAQAIAKEIQAAVTPEENGRLAVARRVNPAAQDEYLLGRFYYWKNNDADFKKAAEHFRKATELQPDYSDPYAALALTLQNFPDGAKESKAPALKAVELDPNLAEAHAALAGVYELDWDWASTEREFKRAVELDPNSLDACGCYAFFLANMGRTQEALALIEHAASVNPLSSAIQMVYGYVLYFSKKYPEAEAHLQKSIELEQLNVFAYMFLSFTQQQEGKSAEAVAALDRPEFRPSALLALAYAKAGRRADALKMVSAVAGMKPNPDQYGTALTYFVLGDKDRGVEWLTKSMDSQEVVAPAARFDPTLDEFRSDPRVQAQIARLHIPDPPGH